MIKPEDSPPAIKHHFSCPTEVDHIGVYEIEVSAGGDKFSPVTYNSFEVPRVVVRVRATSKEDTPDAMFKRAYAIADGYVRNTYELALKEHIARCARGAEAARAYSKGK